MGRSNRVGQEPNECCQKEACEGTMDVEAFDVIHDDGSGDLMNIEQFILLGSIKNTITKT